MVKIFYKNNYFYINSFIFFILLALFTYRSLLFNLSTNLLDWNDYPLFVWIMQHNINHISSFSFSNFFDTNIYYPFQGNLLFSDIFLPTSILGYLVQFFIKSPISSFNIVFFLVLIINPISCFFFWKNFFSSKWLLFFATLSSAFSPFILTNSYYFQMLNIWPVFFCLGFLLRKELRMKNVIFGGVFLALQFWTSIYYAIFALFIISVWYLIKILEIRKSKIQLKILFKRLFIFFIIFLFLSGILIVKYLQIKNAYNVNREYWEYVIYAAHPTDYIFLPYKSLLSELNIFQKWNSFNHHGSAAGFPGFVLLVLSLIGILSYQKINQVKTLVLKINSNTLFFLILIFCGFIFSLGPRLSINGVYLEIPLPYVLIIKLVPLFEPLRVDGRWAFLISLALTYFACLGIKKVVFLTRGETMIMLWIVYLYLVEIIPIARITEAKPYYNPVYATIKNQCLLQKTVLLEYPLSQDRQEKDVVTGLSYKTQMLLASINHECYLVNGYSGYSPKDYGRYENELYAVVLDGEEDKFYQLLKQRSIDYFKLNKNEIYNKKAEVIENWLLEATKYIIIINNNEYLIAKVL